MRILLTNDDSINSDGIKALMRTLSPAHEVWVVAPETEKSGGSHSITIHDSLRVRVAGERLFSCRGTPADCVMIALLGLVPVKIDLILSGINHGVNLGTDILFSGTAAGARQGALMGVPSVAISMAIATPPYDFTPAAEFALRNLQIFRELGTDDHFMNVNVPFGASRETRPVITFPSRRIYGQELSQYRAPDGDIYCFISGALPGARPEEGSDSNVLEQGCISISPIHAHPRNWASIEECYRGVKFS
ncbi:MAG: 5'/3'-nucleotidase SurE [Spirochaetia bacterium]|jgi:5'-nucleotidase